MRSRCLGGTVDEPAGWVRFDGDDVQPVEGSGRVCKRTIYPSGRAPVCRSCVLYRGPVYVVHRDRRRSVDVESVSTGLRYDGSPRCLSLAEYADWLAAQESALEDDDFSAMARWTDRMNDTLPDLETMRISGDFNDDPDVRDYRNAKMRRYRARHPEQTARDTARKQAWRARMSVVSAPRGSLEK